MCHEGCDGGFRHRSSPTVLRARHKRPGQSEQNSREATDREEKYQVDEANLGRPWFCDNVTSVHKLEEALNKVQCRSSMQTHCLLLNLGRSTQ